MTGILLEDQVLRERRFEEEGAVELFDGPFVDEARTHRFSSAGETRHEMALHEAGGDLEIGPVEVGVDEHIPAGRAGSDKGERARILAVMIEKQVIAEDFFAEHFGPLRGGARPVHPVSDDNLDVFPGNSLRLQPPQKRPEKAVRPAIGHGTGNVGDGHRRGEFSRLSLAPDDL